MDQGTASSGAGDIGVENRERLIFVHVPKTAGVSLSVFLCTQFAPEQVFHVRAPGPGPSFGAIQGPVLLLKRMPAEWQARIRCALGHFRYSEEVHTALPGSSRYITTLRDPVERALSQHGHLNRKLHLEGRSLLSLRQFLQSPTFVDNQQTRIFCSGSFEEQSESAALESAKNNLSRRFSLVGTTERVDDFVRLLCERWGFERRPAPRENDTPNRLRQEDVSSELLHELRARTELDRELHLQAGALLDAALSTAGSPRSEHAFSRRLDKLQRGARRRLGAWIGTKRNDHP